MAQIPNPTQCHGGRGSSPCSSSGVCFRTGRRFFVSLTRECYTGSPMMHSDPLDPAKSKTTAEVRVRFCDTDLMGIVHHANYFAYFEVGRVEWLRKRGVAYTDWASRGLHLPVVDASIRYRVPARFDDVL